MKRVMFIILLTLAIVIGLGGCRKSEKAQPSVIIEDLAPGLDEANAMWAKEISRRFDNAVGVIVHGGDFVEGQWIVGAHLQPDQHVSLATDIVAYYQKKHPGKILVFISCNPGHLKLGVPGVYYAMSNVWVMPDRAISPDMMELSNRRWNDLPPGYEDFGNYRPTLPSRWENDPDTVGNIFEFVTE